MTNKVNPKANKANPKADKVNPASKVRAGSARRPARGTGAPTRQVCGTTHDGIRPTHVQNSAEDYQKTQRTIKLTRRSSHEPGSATRQRDPALAAVPQRYPRPSRSSKKTRSPTLPIPNEGGLDYYTNDGS